MLGMRRQNFPVERSEHGSHTLFADVSHGPPIPFSRCGIHPRFALCSLNALAGKNLTMRCSRGSGRTVRNIQCSTSEKHGATCARRLAYLACLSMT
jgi:hypothetical protein